MAKLVRITWESDSGQTYNIALDASISERHSAPSTITDHAVEKGTNVADHIRPDPDILSIEGFVSNTPILLPGDHVDGARGVQVEVEGVAPSVRIPLPIAGSLIGNIPIAPSPKGHVLGFEPAFDRVAAVYEELLKIRNDGRLVRVITTLREYDNMGMSGCDAIRDAEHGNALALTLEFKQVRFGSTETVPVPVIPRNKSEKGNKVLKPTSPEPPGAENASALFNAFGGH